VAYVTEFERQLKLSGANGATEKALKAEATKPKGVNLGRKKRGKCYNCGEKGHWKKECLKPPKDKGSKDPNKPKGSTKSLEKNASTGPLPTPGGSKGLSPPHTANKSTKQC
jgi:hypothetical protein